MSKNLNLQSGLLLLGLILNLHHLIGPRLLFSKPSRISTPSPTVFVLFFQLVDKDQGNANQNDVKFI